MENEKRENQEWQEKQGNQPGQQRKGEDQTGKRQDPGSQKDMDQDREKKSA